MAESTIFGLNTGLDTADIIDKLVALERKPIDLQESKRAIEDEKLTTFQDLKSRLKTFKSVLTTLNTSSRFIETQGEFSNNSASDNNEVVGIETTSQATSGTFSLTVNQLARETKIISEGFESKTSTLPKGTLRITVGSSVKEITIDSSNNTLDGLRLAINNSGANVQASFLNDGSSDKPVKLLISGTKTGTDNAVTVELVQSLVGGGDQSVVDFTETQAALNAGLVVDGVSVTKSDNVITDVINGATLTLKSAGSGTITLSSDQEAIQEKIFDFVDAYNDLMLFLNEQLALDPDTFETGTLFGNFTVQNIQQTLRSTISSRVTGVSGSFEFLSQIGIRTASDGTLTVDEAELSDAITADIQNVSQLFSSKGTATNTHVTFVGFTGKTQPGTYDVRVSGGVPQLSPAGKNDFTDAVGSGNFFAGAKGTDAEGLNFRIGSLSDGDFGTITLSIGVAETLNRFTRDLTDFSLNGPLSAEIDTLTETIDEIDETILDLEERVDLFEDNLRKRFTNLEIVVGRLNSQRDAFESSIEGVKNLFSSSTGGGLGS